MWDRWPERWGPLDGEPRLYWQPWLGEVFGLRPADIELLTPYQLDACRDLIDERAK